MVIVGVEETYGEEVQSQSHVVRSIYGTPKLTAETKLRARSSTSSHSIYCIWFIRVQGIFVRIKKIPAKQEVGGDSMGAKFGDQQTLTFY